MSDRARNRELNNSIEDEIDGKPLFLLEDDNSLAWELLKFMALGVVKTFDELKAKILRSKRPKTNANPDPQSNPENNPLAKEEKQE